MELLVVFARSRRQETWQLVVQEGFKYRGRIFLCRRPESLLEPHEIKGLFPGDLIPDQVQELRDFPAVGRPDRLGFFLLSASCAIAVCSITAHNSLKMA